VFGALLLLSGAALFGCGDDGGSKPQATAEGPLTFTREDGTTLQFPGDAETYIWCGPWEEGSIEEYAIHVWHGTLAPEEARWELLAVVDDILLETPFEFPNFFIWDQPDSALIFIYDPPNELATHTDDSSGSLIFHAHPCGSGTTIDFSIDAVIGSEFGQMPTVTMKGRFTADATGEPPWRARRLDGSDRRPATRAASARLATPLKGR
jgi:hypothetical protein